MLCEGCRNGCKDVCSRLLPMILAATEMGKLFSVGYIIYGMVAMSQAYVSQNLNKGSADKRIIGASKTI